MVIPGWNLLLANTWKVKNLIGLPGACQVNLSLGLQTDLRRFHFCQASWLGCQLYHPRVLSVVPRALQAQRAVVHDHPAGEAALLKVFHSEYLAGQHGYPCKSCLMFASSAAGNGFFDLVGWWLLNHWKKVVPCCCRVSCSLCSKFFYETVAILCGPYQVATSISGYSCISVIFDHWRARAGVLQIAKAGTAKFRNLHAFLQSLFQDLWLWFRPSTEHNSFCQILSSQGIIYLYNLGNLL